MNKFFIIWLLFLVRGVLCGNTGSYHAQEEKIDYVEAGCILKHENLSPHVRVETLTRVYYKGQPLQSTSPLHLAADIMMNNKPRDSFYFSDRLYYDKRTFVWYLYGQPITESCTEIIEMIQYQLAQNGLPYYNRNDILVLESQRPMLYPDLDDIRAPGLLRVATAPAPTPRLGDVPINTIVKPRRLQRTASGDE